MIPVGEGWSWGIGTGSIMRIVPGTAGVSLVLLHDLVPAEAPPDHEVPLQGRVAVAAGREFLLVTGEPGGLASWLLNPGVRGTKGLVACVPHPAVAAFTAPDPDPVAAALKLGQFLRHLPADTWRLVPDLWWMPPGTRQVDILAEYRDAHWSIINMPKDLLIPN